MDLPYFKFMVADWFSGDIQCCTHTTKGIFIDLCSQMWMKGGYLPDDDTIMARLCRCELDDFKKARAELEQWSIIDKTDDDQCCVSFVVEQLSELSDKHDRRVKAGRKGGNANQLNRRSNAKAMLKQSSSISDTDTESDPEGESENPPLPPKGADGRSWPKRKRTRLTQAEKRRIRVDENTDMMIRIGGWFGRQPSTLWTVIEAEALEEVLKGTNEQEIKGMEGWYTAENVGSNYTRKSVEQLLNNWSGDLDRARRFYQERREGKL